jgi:short-subunit dehydrogenase
MPISNGGPSLDPRHLLLVGPGLGSAIARRFAREGYRVTLVARSAATLDPIAQELGAAGAEVASIQADAGEPDGTHSRPSSLRTAPRAS